MSRRELIVRLGCVILLTASVLIVYVTQLWQQSSTGWEVLWLVGVLLTTTGITALFVNDYQLQRALQQLAEHQSQRITMLQNRVLDLDQSLQDKLRRE